MLKNFNIESFKKEKPPKDNSLKTMSEISSIKNIPDDKKFVKINDDVSKRFNEVVKDKDIDVLIEESVPHILKLKKYFNRPRPKDIAKTFGIKLKDIELKSMKTPSYPSGHSAQGVLIAKVLGDKHPAAKQAFAKTGKNISYSRRVARAHYKSDSKLGVDMGNKMEIYITNKNKNI